MIKIMDIRHLFPTVFPTLLRHFATFNSEQPLGRILDEIALPQTIFK